MNYREPRQENQTFRCGPALLDEPNIVKLFAIE